jgi:hypothetical protein
MTGAEPATVVIERAPTWLDVTMAVGTLLAVAVAISVAVVEWRARIRAETDAERARASEAALRKRDMLRFQRARAAQASAVWVEYPEESDADTHVGTVCNLSTRPVFRVEFYVVLMEGTRPLPAAHRQILMPGDSWKVSYSDDFPRRGVPDYIEADFLDAARVPWRVNSDGHVVELGKVSGEPLDAPESDHSRA